MNRRIRVRMCGGVRGRGLKSSLLLDFFHEEGDFSRFAPYPIGLLESKGRPSCMESIRLLFLAEERDRSPYGRIRRLSR